MAQAVSLKRIPLHSVHVSMGARMVDFGGWEMPVQYSGVVDEHCAVRHGVGLFDVSHMGEIEIRGRSVLRSAVVAELTAMESANLVRLGFVRGS